MTFIETGGGNCFVNTSQIVSIEFQHAANPWWEIIIRTTLANRLASFYVAESVDARKVIETLLEMMGREDSSGGRTRMISVDRDSGAVSVRPL
jgi:hypothetical protein